MTWEAFAADMWPSAFWAFVLYVPAMFFNTSPFGLAYGSLPVIAPPAMRAVVTSVFMCIVDLGMLLGLSLLALGRKHYARSLDAADALAATTR
jgi:hypothetical protein